MDRRSLAVAGLGVLALGMWWWLGHATDTPAPAAVAASRSSLPSPAFDAGTRAADAAQGDSASGPCTEHWLTLPVGTELRYVMSVSEGSDTQSGDYRLRLVATHIEADERVESWLASISFAGADEQVDTTFERRCSDRLGAQEPWMGLDFAGLSELEVQGWRWPIDLRAGASFGGELRRTMLDQMLSAQRQHRVLGVESVSTPAGTFEAWQVEVTDHAQATTTVQHGDVWVMPGIGLVRLLQPTGVGTLRLELAEITRGDG